MSLSEIVNVQITRETKAVTRVGFGTMLILGPNLNSASRTEAFTELSAVVDALAGGTGAPEYLAAADAMAQNPRVTQIKIGQIQGTKTLTDDAGTYTAGDITVTVNGTDVVESFSVDKDTTLTALAASIQALASVSTAVYSSVAHTIVITPATGYVLGIVADLTAITGSMTMTLSATATEAITDALNNIVQSDDDWFGLVCITRTQADQLAAAAWVESQEMKVAAFASNEADTIDKTLAEEVAAPSSLAYKCYAAGYARSAVIYSGTPTDYPDAALLGRILPYDPGTYTAKFKTLASITVDSLTSTQSTNARAKKCNVYEQIGGVNIVREGTMAEGEFIDVIIFVDWLDARITEAVYSLLVKQLKVPYTEAGIAAVKSAINEPLQVGQNRGGISPTAFDSDDNQIGGYVIVIPALEDIPTADKTNRLLQDVEFTAWLAGAIHAVTINGVVTL